MAFMIRSFATIAATMIADFVAKTRSITDYTKGAVARSLLESSAMEMQRMDVAVSQGIREGIETGTYRSFDFARLPAVYAQGAVVVTRSSDTPDMTLSAGHRFRVPGSSRRIYAVLEDVPFPVGTTEATALVRAMEAGAVGNTAAATIVESVDAMPFVATLTNPAPLLNGVDQESDEDRRNRFRQMIAGLSRGTMTAIEYAARSVVLSDSNNEQIERVVTALVREPFRSDPPGFLGHVEVYVDNGGGSASQALLDAVERAIVGYTDEITGAKIPGYIAAGISLEVLGVTSYQLAVAVTITLAPGFSEASVTLNIQTAVQNYLLSLRVFAVAYLSEIIAAVMGVDGVVDVTIETPAENVLVSYGQRIIPGTVTVTVET